jgi:hypothetical protein
LFITKYGLTLSRFYRTTLDAALDGLYEDVPQRPTKKLRPGRKIECKDVDKLDPAFFLVESMNQLLKSGAMTQAQYDFMYNDFIYKSRPKPKEQKSPIKRGHVE